MKWSIESDGLLISGEDKGRAVVKMDPNRAVGECIAHAVLIAIVDPGCDENSLLWQIHIIARVAEQLSLCERIECGTQCFGCSIESVQLQPRCWSCGATRGPYNKWSNRGSSMSVLMHGLINSLTNDEQFPCANPDMSLALRGLCHRCGDVLQVFKWGLGCM